MAPSSSLTFQPGQTDRECVLVSIENDNIPEETESFTFILSSNDPDVTPNLVSAEGSITDDDGINN